MAASCLVVGVGSHHGADQLGWRVVESLRTRVGDDVETRCALSPADVLDWARDFRELHIVDACQGLPAGERIGRWRWPELPTQLNSDRFSSHASDVRSALTLGERLGLLPPTVVVWGLSIDSGDQELSAAAIAELARELAARLAICRESLSPTA